MSFLQLTPRLCSSVSVPMSESPIADGGSSDEGDLWEVQDILAQRLTLSGEIEYLVVWRSSWTAAHLVKDGPILRHWLAVSKFKTSGAMAVSLPVVRGTQLYSDCRRIAIQRAAQRSISSTRVLGAACASTPVSAPAPSAGHDVASRLQLGSPAQRVRRE